MKKNLSQHLICYTDSQMPFINLTRGFKTQVDDEDFEELQKHRWCVQGPTNGGYYAVCRMNGKIVSMSRWLLNAMKTDYVDHLNGDTLDNRRWNLRLVRNSDNVRNSKLRKTNKTGIRGVCWDKRRQKFLVTCKVKGKQHFIGYVDDLETGGQMHRRYLEELLGKDYETEIFPKQFGAINRSVERESYGRKMDSESNQAAREFKESFRSERRAEHSG